MSVSMFNANVLVSEQLSRMLTNAAQDLAQRAVNACAEQYGFDGMEAIRMLGLESVKLERKPSGKQISQRVAKVKIVAPKAAFPLPFNGEFNDAYCYALRQNNGLYTQCQIARKGDKHYCKSCQALADKSENGVPEYGTIQDRMAVGIFEYVDPKGRKPVAYTKVMKKYKISQEQVLEEAGKFNIIIADNHFVVAEDAKRGRPSSKKEKAPKEPKGAKGRPKKAKKVLQIEGDEDDLFAALVADANVEEDEEMVIAPKKKGKSEEEKEAERLAKEAEKALKEEQRLKEKAEKEAKLAAEKLEKEQKKEAERLAKEAKKLEEAEAKRLKEEQRLKEKAEKEAKLAAEKESKKTKKAPAAKAAEPEVDDEPDVVKKIEFEGKKYLKSKKTGIVYDYNEYVKNGEQVVVGHWNDTKNKIDFEASAEESEEEYD